MNRRLAAPAAALVLLTGCSAGTAEEGPDVAAPSSSSAEASPSVEPSPSPTAKVIEASYAGGEVSGVEQRIAVELGEKLVLRFTSDVAEEIHVHGYDLYADLVPGTPAEITFVADIPGSFEVELHEAGRPLYQLRVAP